MLFKVALLLLLAGNPNPMRFTHNTAQYQTVEACKADLPRLEAELVTEAAKNGKARGVDFEAELSCFEVDADDGSI